MIGDSPVGLDILSSFIDRVKRTPQARVLELGSKRSVPHLSTVHRDWVADDATLILSDFEKGLDVDVVADLHSISENFRAEEFDFIFMCSVLEHVRRPWIAATELFKILKPGGEIFVQTHQAFPIHGFPEDYWRFTMEGLSLIFGDAGFEKLEPGYDFPCKVVCEGVPTDQGTAFLNSVIAARRPLKS